MRPWPSSRSPRSFAIISKKSSTSSRVPARERGPSPSRHRGLTSPARRPHSRLGAPASSRTIEGHRRREPMPSLVTFPRILAALAAFALLGPAAAPGGEDWKILFDGKSTDAWRGYSRDGFPAGCWAIEGDTLKTVSGGKGPCDLVTREPYRDFDFELEYKLSPGGNSGVLYRVAELPGEPSWHSGPEMQILDDDKYRQNSPKN